MLGHLPAHSTFPVVHTPTTAEQTRLDRVADALASVVEPYRMALDAMSKHRLQSQEADHVATACAFLLRHMAEQAYAASVLLKKSCTSAVQLNVRSCCEAYTHIIWILQDPRKSLIRSDFTNVISISHRIVYCRKRSINDQLGKGIMKGTPEDFVARKSKFDWDLAIRDLEKLIDSESLSEAYKDYKHYKIRHKRNPSYAFEIEGKYNNITDFIRAIRGSGQREWGYSDWSRYAHASDTGGTVGLGSLWRMRSIAETGEPEAFGAEILEDMMSALLLSVVKFGWTNSISEENHKNIMSWMDNIAWPNFTSIIDQLTDHRGDAPFNHKGWIEHFRFPNHFYTSMKMRRGYR